MKKFLSLFLVACMTAFLYADEQVSAATSFTLKGISSMKMEVLNKADGRQVLVANSQVVFENFTSQTLGRTKAQAIRLSDLKVAVSIVDTTKPAVEQTVVDDDGTVIVINERPSMPFGKGKISDLVIPAEGMTKALPLTIVSDFSSVENGQTSMTTVDFIRLKTFTNLFTGTQKERETVRLVLTGTCKVAILGENGAWLWDSNDYNFSWELKSSNQSGLVLESENSRY